MTNTCLKIHIRFKSSTILGETCVSPFDCHKVNFATCSKNKTCECVENFVADGNSKCLSPVNDDCMNDDDCLGDLSCINSQCKCQINFQLTFDNQCKQNVLKLFCQSDRDCDEVRHAKCSSSNKCVCRPRNTLVNSTICMPMIGAFCWKDEPCAIDNSACINSTCQCKPEFKYFSENDVCLNEYVGMSCKDHQNCKSLRNTECSSFHKCVCLLTTKKVNATTCLSRLNSYCEHDEDCVDPHSTCIANKCQCRPNYITIDNDKCELITLGKKCKGDSDCQNLFSDECSADEICVCKLHHVAINESVCQPVLNGICFSSEDCQVKNSKCHFSYCQCKSGFVPFSQNLCLKEELLDSCGPDEGCESSGKKQCSKSGKCICTNKSLTQNPSIKFDCTPLIGGFCNDSSECEIDNSISMLGETCISPFDCYKVNFVTCSENKTCECAENFVADGNSKCLFLVNDGCMNDDDCLGDLSCIDSQCKCQVNFQLTVDNQCKKNIFEHFCQSDKDCDEVRHAKCSSINKCVCRPRNTLVNSTICMPMIGAFCWKDEPCATDNSACINSTCQCKPGFKYFSKNDVCSNEYLGMSCKDHQDCSSLRYTECSSFHKCVCLSTTKKVNATTCLSRLNNYCEHNEDCADPHSFCIANRCQCRSNYISINDFKCELTYIGKPCESNSDCEKIESGECSNDKRCTCNENSIMLDEFSCGPILSGACSDYMECLPENLRCVHNICRCKPGFFASSSFNCSLAVTKLGMACESKAGCKNLYNSDCIGGQCVCQSNTLAVYQTACLSLINGSCRSHEDCLDANSVCIFNRCECKLQYVPVSSSQCILENSAVNCRNNADCSDQMRRECSTNNKCVCKSNSIALGAYRWLLGDAYESSFDCHNVVFTMRTKENKCKCQSHFIAVNNSKCISPLNEFCLNDSDCLTDNSTCNNSQCKCKFDFRPTLSNKCEPKKLLKFCRKNEDCADIIHEKCSIDNECVCRPNNVAVNGSACLPAMNSFCWNNEPCAVENSDCIDSECKCRLGFKNIHDKLCIKTYLEMPCEHDIDCADIKNSECYTL
ncbi:prion-like-(Q/N-rich) domain-bearing protein 25 [Cotesia glomerata]|uniref:prion-like-(Q/N-rich) domain-bearing protein 25 n=1 Tax=Cotesia glomerata TaxID=32391 RepID=UPI001D00584C|nr:prion-like-(Q/N-rich) domain-bearing protein 25 [Cotesia glomerata]